MKNILIIALIIVLISAVLFLINIYSNPSFQLEPDKNCMRYYPEFHKSIKIKGISLPLNDKSIQQVGEIVVNALNIKGIVYGNATESKESWTIYFKCLEEKPYLCWMLNINADKKTFCANQLE
jgi:hypothetical protein